MRTRACLALLCLAGLAAPRLALAQQDPPPVVATVERVDCTRTTNGLIVRKMCEDTTLVMLDSTMVTMYSEASRHVTAAQLEEMSAQQRQWMLAREACTRQENVPSCVGQAYMQRISQLARYAAGAAQQRKMLRFACDDGSLLGVEIIPGEPELAKVTYDKSEWIVPHVKTATGARYYLTGVSVWIKEHDVVFEHNGTSLSCKAPRH